LNSSLFKDKIFLVVLAICIALLVVAILQWPIDYMISIYFLIAIVVLIIIYCIIKSRESGASPAPSPRPEPVNDVPVDDHSEMHIPEVEVTSTDLSELPIETIEGIGSVYGNELRTAGIGTVLDLLGSDPQNVADICDVPLEQAERWIAMSRFAWLDNVSEEDAEAIVFATGITDLKSLGNADPADLLQKVKAGVADGRVRVPEDYEFTLEIVTKWIESAKDLI